MSEPLVEVIKSVESKLTTATEEQTTDTASQTRI